MRLQPPNCRLRLGMFSDIMYLHVAMVKPPYCQLSQRSKSTWWRCKVAMRGEFTGRRRGFSSLSSETSYLGGTKICFLVSVFFFFVSYFFFFSVSYFSETSYLSDLTICFLFSCHAATATCRNTSCDRSPASSARRVCRPGSGRRAPWGESRDNPRRSCVRFACCCSKENSFVVCLVGRLMKIKDILFDAGR